MKSFSRTLTSAVLMASSVTMLAAGQAPEGPAFAAVSIRPLKPASEVDFVATDVVRLAGDRLWGRNVSALGLVRAAYRSEFADPDQILGADGWIASERFDLEARAGSELAGTIASPPFPPVAEAMLQRVLQDRLQLRVRRETRELPRLLLTHARADRSLKPGIRMSGQDCTRTPTEANGKCEFRPLAGKLSMRGQPLKTLVDYLSIPAYSGGRVVDGTGITGTVDVDLEWALDFKDLLSSRANLMTAVQEQLGLKLESRRLRLPVLVIEHIQRPSTN